jgi:predicted HicB family RNase H-like nuclease
MAREIEDKYAYRVTWSERDGEFVATCAEFPSLSWLQKNQTKALHGLMALVHDTVVQMRKAGEPIPQPFVTRRFSGKFKARLPPAVHMRLARDAAEQGVSMNSFLVTVVSAGLGLTEGFAAACYCAHPETASRKKASRQAARPVRA